MPHRAFFQHVILETQAVEEPNVQTKSILVVAILAVVLATAASYAQQSQGERPRAEPQEDSRYLISMRGIT